MKDVGTKPRQRRASWKSANRRERLKKENALNVLEFIECLKSWQYLLKFEMTTLDDYISLSYFRCPMKTFTVTTFKAKALKIIEQISKTHEGVIITKRGKPIVEVSPYTQKETKIKPGKLKGLFVKEKDIIAPLGEDIWNSAK